MVLWTQVDVSLVLAVGGAVLDMVPAVDFLARLTLMYQFVFSVGTFANSGCVMIFRAPAEFEVD